MQTERWIDKSKWGDGAWQHEPDRIEWRAFGFACLMLRNPHGGMWCGYVGLPPGHAWHGKDYDDIDVSVHGGLTFAERCMDDDRPMRERVCHVPQPGESDDVWWLGFDCHHFMDLAPGHEATMRVIDIQLMSKYGATPPRDYTYRDVAYVQLEVEQLAAQCKEAK